MPNYKLTYFDVRGLAEPSRWIFAYAGIKYEDVRYPIGGFTPEIKSEMNLDWGQLPILEIDGKKFAQSKSIARYLARKYKLVGKDEFEELKCDEIVDAVGDFATLWTPIYRESDAVKQADLIKHVSQIDSPIHLAKFNAVLEKNGTGWSVGNEFTWADIYIAHIFNHFEVAFDVDLGLKKYQAIHKVIENVQTLPGIKEWLATRPQTKW